MILYVIEQGSYESLPTLSVHRTVKGALRRLQAEGFFPEGAVFRKETSEGWVHATIRAMDLED